MYTCTHVLCPLRRADVSAGAAERIQMKSIFQETTAFSSLYECSLWNLRESAWLWTKPELSDRKPTRPCPKPTRPCPKPTRVPNPPAHVPNPPASQSEYIQSKHRLI
ncbi:hypothetical protein WMY93_031239 [Mugilogobius chulae]|uniref:Uncharacterized protein n=1 Tax=Mugilogobius chulae TaxID=88201 RepID=A0AAW0MDQ5_9GOBI